MKYLYIVFLPVLFVSTRQDMQNYGCNGNLLCDLGVVERNRISSLESHGKLLEKERYYYHYYYYRVSVMALDYGTRRRGYYRHSGPVISLSCYHIEQCTVKLSVNYCRTNTRKNFLACCKSLEQFTSKYCEYFSSLATFRNYLNKINLRIYTKY